MLKVLKKLTANSFSQRQRLLKYKRKRIFAKLALILQEPWLTWITNNFVSEFEDCDTKDDFDKTFDSDFSERFFQFLSKQRD